MPSARSPHRWRAGARAALYLIAFGILAGGLLIAVGVLLFLFAGVLLGGGIVALLMFLGFLRYFWREERQERPGG